MTTEEAVTIEPAAPAVDGQPAPSPGRAGRIVRYILDLLRRYWATTTLVLTILIVGLATGAFWNQVIEGTDIFDTVAYGVGNWYLYNGEPAKAQEYFSRIVKGHVWVTWGFIGAETEVAQWRRR